MINLQYRTMNSGLPVLSKAEIDILAEALVYDFCPDAMREPQAIDVDMFCEFYLGLNQEFVYLSNCGIFLGMMVFKDTNKVIIWNPEKKEAEYHFVKANTVLIDNSLISNDISKRIETIEKSSIISPRQKQRSKDKLLQKIKASEHRYRFTMAHETAGHAVLHRQYFKNLESILCRTDSKYKSKVDKSYTDMDWIEKQADLMSSSFLMPKSMVQLVIERMELNNIWNSYRYYLMVMEISKVFNVSLDASEIRLKNLGYIPTNHCQK